MAQLALSAFVRQAMMNERHTMTGSKVNEMTRKQVAALVRAIPADKHFVWDGVDEDERPLTREEMRAGIELAKKRAHQTESNTKEQVAIRFDLDVLAAFRASGPGWQTRMNDALKDWLRVNSPT
jgi:uncharacterized protein (DUF4415 family)